MFKKAILIFACSLVIGFFLAFEIDSNNKNKQKKHVIVPLLRGVIDQNINPPIIKDEDIPIQSPVTKKPVIKIKKDLSLITAESYIVGNLQTGELYLKNNTEKIFPIASLSKLFTALAVVHFLDKENKITINKSMLDTFGDAGHLIEGEKYTNEELLYPLLLESSNDAAEAFAQSFGYDKFIDLMNSLAKEIGMDSTSFKDASGLSPSNVSNSNDLFILARYIYNNEKKLLDITKQKEMILATTTDHGYHQFISINPFVPYEPFIGGKTGRTNEAKESMISLFNYRVNTISSSTIPVAVVILRSDFGEREIDTEKILEKLDTKI